MKSGPREREREIDRDGAHESGPGVGSIAIDCYTTTTTTSASVDDPPLMHTTQSQACAVSALSVDKRKARRQQRNPGAPSNRAEVGERGMPYDVVRSVCQYLHKEPPAYNNHNVGRSSTLKLRFVVVAV
uniref:Uncharacterized protein n=1 Tax=Plectus sambesii TaxID=2011161 RepID=A0A914VHL4_9BILA